MPAISGASDVASIAGTSDATTDVAAIAPRHIKFIAFDNTKPVSCNQDAQKPIHESQYLLCQPPTYTEAMAGIRRLNHAVLYV
ncbi:MAG: hypothetical protein ACO3DA_08420, partial [Ilumatobacteraceae bacterium]